MRKAPHKKAGGQLNEVRHKFNNSNSLCCEEIRYMRQVWRVNIKGDWETGSLYKSVNRSKQTLCNSTVRAA